MTTQNAAARHLSVALTTHMTLISGTVPAGVSAELRYTTRDCYAVHMVLSVEDSPAVEWVFARDLLRDGLHAPAGSGDIHVFPVSQGVVIDLLSPHGRARLLAHGDDLAGFVDDMYEAVPDGAETQYFSLERELAMLHDLQAPRALDS